MHLALPIRVNLRSISCMFYFNHKHTKPVILQSVYALCLKLMGLKVLIAIVAISIIPQTAVALWRPIRPVEMVVPNSLGGGNDAVARLMQRLLQERKLINPATVVVNKSACGGSVAVLAKHLEAGLIRILALISDKNLSGPIANIPNWKEQGYRGTFNTWRGI